MSLPLFITSCSLTSASAIGVQTKLLLEQFPDWRHLYWDELDYGTAVRRSTRAESLAFSWFNLFKSQLAQSRMSTGAPQSDNPQALPLPPTNGKGLPSRPFALPKVGLSWWNGNLLKPRYDDQIRKLFSRAISAVYAAPLGIAECERMKSILGSLNKPFVLHLWDLLDENQLDSSAFQWLLVNAVHVLCLSEAMVDYVRPLRPDATILRFTRKPTTYHAAAPTSGTIRIALLGTHKRQRAGLSLLRDTLSTLRERRVPVEIIHMGLKKRVMYWGPELPEEVHATGFIPSDEARDQMLATCHLGFLPGPLSSPLADSYSRFSIPSRILDYMATGLPIIAAVHPSSATAGYLKKMGLEDSIVPNSAVQVAEKVVSLKDQDLWVSLSKKNRAAFEASQQEQSELKHWLGIASSHAAILPFEDLASHLEIGG